MEITNDIKAKVFAQYLGHRIWFSVGNYEVKFQWGFIDNYVAEKSNYKLILKPLSALTNDDAIEAAGVIGGVSHLSKEAQTAQLIQLFSSPNFFVNQTNISGYKWFQCCQYLQSRGYDLPQYLLDGKTLQEVGLAIYEPETPSKND